MRVDFTEHLSRGEDYLGSIASRLGDLAGFQNLANELIQNADDAGAERLRFLVDETGLTVWNSAQFRDCGDQSRGPDDCLWLPERRHRCDFHSFRLVSSRDKVERPGTTGAFGVGFTAVYQITDRPELISAGVHWVIDETAAEGQRIGVCPGCSDCESEAGTRFVLPWALDANSEFRRRTRTQPFALERLEELTQALSHQAIDGLLFLRNVTTIEVSRQAQCVQRAVRSVEGDTVHISTGDVEQRWMILTDDFAEDAAELAARHPGTIPSDRTAEVMVAVPLHAEVSGTLYAYLPTQDTTGLPLHINANFFPQSDRKHISFDGARGEWNEAAIDAAARLLADSLQEVRDLLGPERLWSLLLNVYKLHQGARGEDHRKALRKFWERLESRLPSAPIAWSIQNSWIRCDEALIAYDEAELQHLKELLPLTLSLLDARIRALCMQMSWAADLRMSSLGLAHVLQALREHADGVNAAMEEQGFREVLWLQLDRLMARNKAELQQHREALRALPLAPTADGLRPWVATLRADDTTIRLGRRLRMPVDFLELEALPEDSERLVALSHELTPGDFARGLARVLAEEGGPALVAESVDDILDWFAKRQDLVLQDSVTTEAVRELAIYPGARGLVKLSELAWPGGFEDPLGIADVFDTKKAGKHEAFLRALGVDELSFRVYLEKFVKQAAEDDERVPHDQWREVMRLVARRLGEIADDAHVRALLSELPLVEGVQDGENNFWEAKEAYIPSPPLDRLLGPSYVRAVVGKEARKAVTDLYLWLGVATEARPADVVARVRDVTSAPPDAQRQQAVTEVFGYLAKRVRDKELQRLGPFEELKQVRWLPAKRDNETWHQPSAVCATFVEHLFHSQARFISLPLSAQREGADLLALLGTRVAPTPTELVGHLLHLSSNQTAPPNDLYQRLDQVADDPAVQRLRGKPCLFLQGEGEQIGRWLKPSAVYWSRHPFGRFRATLGPSFSQYGKLLKSLEVPEQPGGSDALDLIRELAERFGRANECLDEEALQVLRISWTMVSESLDARTQAREGVEAMRGSKCVPDGVGLLQLPASIFFEDVQGIAPRLDPALRRFILPRPEGAWRAMQVAGVRELSHAVKTEIVECDGRQEDALLRRLLLERTNLLGRALDPVVSISPRDLRSRIDDLVLVQAAGLHIRYVFDAAVRSVSDVHAVEALLTANDQTLYSVEANGRRSWPSVGRELIRALCFGLAPGAGTANLVAVLRASSTEEGAQELDALGLPDLDPADLLEVEGAVADSFAGDDVAPNEGFGGEDFQPAGADVEPPDELTGQADAGSSGPPPNESGPMAAEKVDEVDEEDTSSGGTGSGSGLPAGGAGGDPSDRKDRGKSAARQRLRSYVLPAGQDDDGDQLHEGNQEESEEDQADVAGVAHVMAFEAQQGRTPQEMAHNHPGYDIESRGADGEVERYIEVKSMTGAWDLMGSALSATQFEKARELGDRFWLYLVESASSSRARLWMIQDPARRVTQFLFDDGWKDIASQASPPPPPLGLPRTLNAPEDVARDRRMPLHEPSEDGEWDATAWVEVPPGRFDDETFAVQCPGRALEPDIRRGSVVALEPIDPSDIEDGELVAVCHETLDPDTGRRFSIRQWWPEHGEGGDLMNVTLAGAPGTGVEPLTLERPAEARVLGRVLEALDVDLITGGPEDGASLVG